MKNSIKLSALFLLVSTGLFAATPVKTYIGVVPAKKDVITFSSLPSDRGINVKVEKNQPGKTIVIIYDKEKNVLLKDVTSNNKTTEKGYVLNQLNNGDYLMEVISNGQVVRKNIYVYDGNQTKEYLIKQ
jgi:hypothetical protein